MIQIVGRGESEYHVYISQTQVCIKNKYFVAGSGKTMILGYRCLHLAKSLSKPVLVLCYNVTLAARLR